MEGTNPNASQRELVLAHNQYALIQDETKGHVQVYVGPHKSSLAGSDRPVEYDPNNGGRFKQVGLENAIKTFASAVEGSYVILENPAADDKKAHPNTGAQQLTELHFGRKVIIPGPVSFPLWPGQVAKTVEGHQLRSNQYVIAKVYNADEASKNLEITASGANGNAGSNNPDNATPNLRSDLVIGQLLVIKGTEKSFFIPPTGLEVIPDRGNFVREAVTLETLEYCILLGEDGKKRYERGPQVVFPSATETFLERGGHRKFRALELNEDMGIHVKVIQDYTEGEGESTVVFHAGQELFITGKETTIYYPRPEHAIIKYGSDKDIHYGIAIPDGSARYALEKATGRVELVMGPKLFLPDSRKQVIVQRMLDDRQVQLWFPNSQAALNHNRELARLGQDASGMIASEGRRREATFGKVEEAADFAPGDLMQRGTEYTPPRTITINDKYEGAVNISVWNGYAVQVVSKTGNRRVVTGPDRVFLGFDETLEILELSTGTPKDDKRIVKTVYLRVANNKVSDEVNAETKDMVPVQILLSYRVNFEGDPAKWFGVENYLKLLTEHMRSVLRGAIKQIGIEQFSNDATSILRDTVLGKHEGENKRPGKSFDENGMVIYDVEVLEIKIGDDEIADMLTEAQRTSVENTLKVADKERELEVTTRIEKTTRTRLQVEAETAELRLKLEAEKFIRELEQSRARLVGDIEILELKRADELERQKHVSVVAAEARRDEKEREDQELELRTRRQALEIESLNAQATAFAERMKAIQPDLIAAMTQFGERDLTAKMAEALAPLAIHEQQGLNAAFEKIFRDTPLSTMFQKALSGNNGSRHLSGD